MVKNFICVFLITIITIVSMPILPCLAENSEKTQLETRVIQTKKYETNDFKQVMKAVANVLQDDGFILKQTNIDLGIITANKEYSKKGRPSLLSILGNGIGIAIGIPLAIASLGILAPLPLYCIYNIAKGSNKVYTIEASINVSDFNQEIKVRANFQEKLVRDNKETKSKNIEDPLFYQEFFSKLDKSLFLESQEI